MHDYVVNLCQVTLQHLPLVGGKNASLGEMINKLSHLGIKVPGGFATTTNAYTAFLQHNQLRHKIITPLSRLTPSHIDNTIELQKISAEIRDLIQTATLPNSVVDAVCSAHEQLQLKPTQSVAVRSSATAEDLANASFAGLQETFLNIAGEQNILQAIKRVYASLFTERAIAYRVQHQFDHAQIAISAGIQKMIRSDLATSGVIFTLDTESGFDQVIFITSVYGLGETLVQGLANPDEFYVHKHTLQEGKSAIISRKLGSKAIKMIYSDSDSPAPSAHTTEKIAVSASEQRRFSLNDTEILTLARQALLIEQHYGKPMDIEWAKDGVDQEIYMVQARPETVKGSATTQGAHRIIKQYYLEKQEKPAKIIVSGRSIGSKIAHGVARILETPAQKDRLKTGEILVTDMTDPDWEPIMKRAAGIVTNRGGRTCHAAIIARELGIPAIVGCEKATTAISDGEIITVCCNGEAGHIYQGKIDYRLDTITIDQLPALPVKLCMNLANPEQAFAYQFIPNDGVGLARLEFIISNMIGVHPNALLNLKTMPADIQQQIKLLTIAYRNPIEFYIEKLSEGIATIAAAFYPKPIIVRFSDFKSNEYVNLLGGKYYEPHEENPMIGYRGASRYLSGNFRECFTLECQAIARVRNQKGLTNTHIMLPFVRTVSEAKQLIDLLKINGLTRNQDLQIYMMCEIPSNALLAEDFLEYFDGFSIGSNDLTQLTLGLDRDSALIADLFDERNKAVLALLKQAITSCKKLNKYVGICGQGPSDHLDFAQWLMEAGVTSMSLSPDSLLKTWVALSKKIL